MKPAEQNGVHHLSLTASTAANAHPGAIDASEQTLDDEDEADQEAH